MIVDTLRPVAGALPANDAARAPLKLSVAGRQGSAAAIDSASLIERFAEALEADFGGKLCAAKLIAQAALCTERCARNWRERKNLPNLVQFIRLAQCAPSVRALFVELVGLQDVVDPAIEGDMLRAIDRYLEARGTPPPSSRLHRARARAGNQAVDERPDASRRQGGDGPTGHTKPLSLPASGRPKGRTLDRGNEGEAVMNSATARGPDRRASAPVEARAVETEASG